MEFKYHIHQLEPDDLKLMNDLLSTLGAVFGDSETCNEKRPGSDYLRQLLGSRYFVALAALNGDELVGGIAAYELVKFEQERSEIYIYDLAVAEKHRRKGIATALIQKLKKIAAARGAYVIFGQADTGVEDRSAIALYTKLGARRGFAFRHRGCRGRLITNSDQCAANRDAMPRIVLSSRRFGC
jgi:aminoglycoside 3-N-acetyltransferase I